MMTKLQFLRRIVANFKAVELPMGDVTQSQIDSSGLMRGKITPQLPGSTGLRPGMLGIKEEAREETYGLVDQIFSNSPRYRRGITFEEAFDEITDGIIKTLFLRDTSAITNEDVAGLEKDFDVWFRGHATSQIVYIPCSITRFKNPRFVVGPVEFTHLEDFLAEQRARSPGTFDLTFSALATEMQREGAHWIARVEILECSQKKAQLLANHVTDLAIASLQLLLPIDAAQYMARMTARTMPHVTTDLHEQNGQLNAHYSFKVPGQSLDAIRFQNYLKTAESVLVSVGYRIQRCLATDAILPALNLAWCDAAYWYHEGLAEPLDTIAVPKLETAIENLLHAESTPGSEQRMLTAIRHFYGREADQTINPTSPLTVKKFVKQFIRDRSRILHGTWSTLMGHLPDSRPTLTAFVRALLLSYTIALDKYCSSSNPSDTIVNFLKWVESQQRN
jgi:hypothetical protein